MKKFFEGLLGLTYPVMILVTLIWFPLDFRYPAPTTYGEVMMLFVIRVWFSLVWPITWLFKLMETPL